jgi:hypothetical protein
MEKDLLLPISLCKSLPKLGATEHEADPLIRVKFFYPDFEWTWYGIEFDGVDVFFGLVDGFEPELGYFTLSELLANRGTLGCEIERDFHFRPCPLSAVQYPGRR